MRSKAGDFVRAFLPLVPLAMCPGCGSGGSEQVPVTQASVPVSTPAATPSGNRAPTISGDANKVAQVGSEYAFQPEWADAEGDSLTFTANNLPAWAALDPKTGRISGTPHPTDV